MATTDEREPTDAEREAASRRAFTAAFAVVEAAKIDKNFTMRSVAATTFKAIIAANAAIETMKNELGSRMYLSVDVMHVVATAWWAHVVSIEEPDEVSPESVGGLTFLGFASACVLLQAHADFDYATTYWDDEVGGGCHAQEALDALPEEEDDAAQREDP